MIRLAAFLLLAAAALGQYRIAGTLINAATGQPIARARVFITPEGSDEETAMMTGADGRFSFDGLAAGEWLLQADRTGFPHLMYGTRPESMSFFSAVITGPENDTTHLVFRAFPPCVIHGRVSDENDQVLVGMVQLLRDDVVIGRRRTRAYSVTRIDDRGEYRFWNIPAGTYYVQVTPMPVGPTRERPLPQFFRNTSDVRLADPLELRPGEELVADLTVHSRPAGSTPDLARPATRPAAVEIRATMRAPEGQRKTETQASVTLFSDQGAALSNTGSANTPFSLGRAEPGTYHLVVSGLQGLYVKTLSAEGAKVSGMSVEIPSSGPVRLTLTLGDDPGRVKGKVYVDGKPGEAMMVILAPREQNEDPDAYQTESDGSFEFKNVKPGEYTLCVTPNLGIEWATRSKLPPGRPLRVEPNGKYDLRLEVAPPNGS